MDNTYEKIKFSRLTNIVGSDAKIASFILSDTVNVIVIIKVLTNNRFARKCYIAISILATTFYFT